MHSAALVLALLAVAKPATATPPPTTANPIPKVPTGALIVKKPGTVRVEMSKTRNTQLIFTTSQLVKLPSGELRMEVEFQSIGGRVTVKPQGGTEKFYDVTDKNISLFIKVGPGLSAQNLAALHAQLASCIEFASTAPQQYQSFRAQFSLPGEEFQAAKAELASSPPERLTVTIDAATANTFICGD